MMFPIRFSNNKDTFRKCIRRSTVLWVFICIVGFSQLFSVTNPSLDSEYAIIFLVDAKHLDYTNFQTLVNSVINNKKNNPHCYVGHAWVILRGEYKGKKIFLEGGHSGELGVDFPCYLDGMVSSAYEKLLREPNPIRYLHTTLYDGFFQKGPGVHTPTFAAFVPLEKAQFELLYETIQPERYDFSSYSLTKNQCVTFIVRLASLVGLKLDYEVTVPVPSTCTIHGEKVVVWRDSRYESLTIPSPDILEHSLKKAVQEKNAFPALEWYLQERDSFSQ